MELSHGPSGHFQGHGSSTLKVFGMIQHPLVPMMPVGGGELYRRGLTGEAEKKLPIQENLKGEATPCLTLFFHLGCGLKL